jgi:hypothetical protein
MEIIKSTDNDIVKIVFCCSRLANLILTQQLTMTRMSNTFPVSVYLESESMTGNSVFDYCPCCGAEINTITHED